MLSVPERLSRIYSCHALYELNRQFGGERESLPQGCIPSQIDEPLEPLASPQS